MTTHTKPHNLVRGATGEWEIIVGMEIHAQVTSRSKLFSGASTAFGGEPNSHVSLVDAAMPGMLPVINERMRGAGRAHRSWPQRQDQPCARCSTARTTSTPDLPQGYQISQFKDPIVGEGVRSSIDLEGGRHRERDRHRAPASRAGCRQELHDQHPKSESFVDLNRSGVALMEIVSEPGHALGRRGGKAYRNQAALPSCVISAPATATWSEGSHALRRQRLCAQAGRTARHALRDQERQFDPLPDEAGRRCSRRAARSQILEDGGKPSCRRRACSMLRAGRDSRVHAQQGRRARLPLLPRSRPAPAGDDDQEFVDGIKATTCPSCPTPVKGALHQANTASLPMTRACLSLEKETAAFFDSCVAQGGIATRREGRGQAR